ncbi:hypothetical protein RRG08_001130 [Elysia crispata]|uniref:Uncharacterized protein n=1 Tax=Elysia crispata TaxID=231223 RepID=A0AAE0Z788_9GAST|nr:hypothetical protein RRG08_001130 [Elysia crispata]
MVPLLTPSSPTFTTTNHLQTVARSRDQELSKLNRLGPQSTGSHVTWARRGDLVSFDKSRQRDRLCLCPPSSRLVSWQMPWASLDLDWTVLEGPPAPRRLWHCH